MMTVLTLLWVLVAALATAVWVWGIIAGYREDDTVHLADGEEGEIRHQVQTEHLMHKIERWRTALSLSTVIGGVVVLGLYVYLGLTQTGLTPLK
jgi:hypothetical protein